MKIFGLKEFNERFNKQGACVQLTPEEERQIFLKVQKEYHREDIEYAVENFIDYNSGEEGDLKRNVILENSIDRILNIAENIYDNNGDLTFGECADFALIDFLAIIEKEGEGE